jgi:hypothetical protein
MRARALVDALQPGTSSSDRGAWLETRGELGGDSKAFAAQLQRIPRARTGIGEHAPPLFRAGALRRQGRGPRAGAPALERLHVRLQLARFDAAEDAGARRWNGRCLGRSRCALRAGRGLDGPRASRAESISKHATDQKRSHAGCLPRRGRPSSSLPFTQLHESHTRPKATPRMFCLRVADAFHTFPLKGP